MNKVIKVVVDLPLKKLNKEYDYLLPDNLISKIKVGQIVRVPFGRRKIAAFVTEVDAEAEIEISKLKKVDSLIYENQFFDQNLLDLFRWTAAYYHAYLAQVIKNALPPGITEKKIKKKKIEFLKINKKIDNLEEELESLKNRAPKQYLILKHLIENKKTKNKLKEVIKYAETSKQTVQRLIDKNLIILYTDIKDRRPEIKSNYILDDQGRAIDAALNNKDKDILAELFNDSSINNYLFHTTNKNRHYNLIFKIIDKIVNNKANVILLIPEIEKDYFLLKNLKEKYGNNIAFLHSRLSKGERFDEWQRIKKGEVQIAVGARSAVFAPFKELECIIILEENNENYKQQEHPLYHARQIAAKRLKNKESILILESPFPSVESRYLAEEGIYKEFQFEEADNQISVEVIDMRDEIENGNLGDLSKKLKSEINNNLIKNEKVLLFLNRRGSANYIICRKCGNVIKCENCNISLNYHQDKDNLKCHYCGFEKTIPDNCPECGSSFISRAGVGTENILDQLNNDFEDAVIARVDSDQSNEEIESKLNSFKKGNIDILVGTSLIIKNNFYNELSLLAVISADTALNSSDFRSAENNYILLKQLKSLLKNNQQSRFLIQSYEPKHYSIKAAAEDDQNFFYQKEKEIRKHRNYPPFCRLLNIIISGNRESQVEKVSKELCRYLDQYNNKFIEKLAAVPAVLSKLRKKYRWQIILKFDSIRNREYIIQLIEKRFKSDENDSIQIRIDVDPYQML